VPRRDSTLFIHEEVMLLALRNKQGTVAGGVMYAQAAGGAILAELLLRARLGAVREGRSTYVVVNDPTPVGDPLLDECLANVGEARRRGTLARWVQRFAGIRQLKDRVAAGLADKGVLRADEDKVLLIFTRRIYPELDPAVEQEIIERIRDAIDSDSRPVDPRTTVLIALAHHAGLLRANFDRKHLKARRARIDAIIRGDAIGQATREAIQAVQVAIMMATMPAIITSTTSH
jgi:golgi phosphoprotein 3